MSSKREKVLPEGFGQNSRYRATQIIVGQVTE